MCAQLTWRPRNSLFYGENSCPWLIHWTAHTLLSVHSGQGMSHRKCEEGTSLDDCLENPASPGSPFIPLTVTEDRFQMFAVGTTTADGGEGRDELDGDENDILDSSLTPMDWLSRLNARAGLVEESSSMEEKKPPYSYATLIRLAILNSEDQKATLSDIYRWIQDEFVYYQQLTNSGWKNSIRHNLSLNKSFLKMARSRQDPGKGCYWTLNPLYNKQQVFDKNSELVLLSSGTMENDFMPNLKKIQEEHIRQWKLLLADQLASIQSSTQEQSISLPLHFNREESMPGLLLDDWLSNSSEMEQHPLNSARRSQVDHTFSSSARSQADRHTFSARSSQAAHTLRHVKDPPDPDFFSSIGAAAGLDWNYWEGLHPTGFSHISKIKKEELSWTGCGGEPPSLPDIFRCVDPAEVMDRCVDPAEVMDLCVDPAKVMDQQRLPSLWSKTKTRCQGGWRDVPDFVDEDISIDYDKLL